MGSGGMRKSVASVWTVVACVLVIPGSVAQDPLIEALASQVDLDEVTSIIQTLEGFETRYSGTPECDEAADWLYDTMQDFGLEVEFEEFEHEGKILRNVVGRLWGSVRPKQVFIIGAHYDSTSQNPLEDAPGADDNASGVAAVLEAARIFAGHEFESTVEFICFGGEEQGRLGSEHNAAVADSATDRTIKGVINLDMIGYWPPSSDQELDIGKNLASSSLALVVENAAATYASIPVHNWPDTGVCYDDHVSYWFYGIEAVVLMDCYEAHANPGGSGESTPHYHSTNDTLATLDLAQTTEAVRVAVAAMAVLAQPIVSPMNLTVSKNAGDVHLSWDGGVPPYALEACPDRQFATGVEELTPPGGITETEWLHVGALDDGVDYYYRVH